jgi:hypothetical protein
MRKEEVWAAFVKGNPGWVSEGARLSPKGIRKVFDETWRLAHAEGRRAEKEYVRAHCQTFEEMLIKATEGFRK